MTRSGSVACQFQELECAPFRFLDAFLEAHRPDAYFSLFLNDLHDT